MIHVDVKNPMIIKDMLDEQKFLNLKDHLINTNLSQKSYDSGFGRYDFGSEILTKYSFDILPIARKIFNSETLIPTYALHSHYEGEKSNLGKHFDDNACTYTLDFCAYQTDPWDIWVEGKPYTLQENQALAFYGEAQEHWREKFPSLPNQKVGMVFFHFVEPDHWWATKGPDYVRVIREEITEEEWKARYNR